MKVPLKYFLVVSLILGAFVGPFGYHKYQQWKSALDVLQQSHAVAAADPEYYLVLLNLYRWTDVRRSRYRAALDEALGRFPNHDAIYFSASGYYSPAFGGSSCIQA